jgi:hypothetical protein
VAVDWEHAEPVDTAPDALLTDTPAEARAAAYGALPAAASNAKSYAAWTKDFSQWVMRAEKLTLYSAPSLKLTSNPGESERDFRIRIQQAARESKDEALAKLRASYAPKLARLNQRVLTAQDAVAREERQAQESKTQAAVSLGATVLGALLGRKVISMSTLGRATTAARGVGRSMKESQDIGKAQDKAAAADAEMKALEAELNEEIAALAATDVAHGELDTIEIPPKRGAVDVRLVALTWKPIG